MTGNNATNITLFHCTRALSEDASVLFSEPGLDVKNITLACSSMVKDVYLLKAFEAGADAVVVITCPEGECRYVDGNIRAKKRVERVKGMLDEIGLGGERLSFHNVPPGDEDAIRRIVKDAASAICNAPAD